MPVIASRRLRDPRSVLGVALAVGLAIRLLRVAEHPLIHPDGPAYLGLARAVLAGEWPRVLGGYYSPLYPIAIAPLLAGGVPAELAGRLVATVAGVLALPPLFYIARRLGGDALASATVLLAAVHPALVKASAQVLPETLAGVLLLAWGVTLSKPRTLCRVAGAGVLVGAAYLVRPEGVLLAPIGAVWIGWGRRGGLVVFLLAAALVMAPAVLTLRARTGTWQLSPREAALAVRAGLSDETSLVAAVLHHPESMLRRWGAGVARQTWNTAVALGPVPALPLLVGLRVAAPAWPLAVVTAFVAGPLALDPSPRYAVPILPLLLPWAGVGVIALSRRLGRRAAPACGCLLLVLALQGLWRDKPFDQACSHEVRDLILARYGPGQVLVAVDGRFAYVADARAIVPKTTEPQAAIALARERHARLWLTRPQWLGPTFAPPREVHEVARPCGGTFVLFELDEIAAD